MKGEARDDPQPGSLAPAPPGPMRGRPRDRILAVATRLFLQEGIQAVGVARIVEQAGVAPMTLYRHFGAKDGLVVAVLEQWSVEWIGWLVDQVDRCGDDPGARLAGLSAALEQGLRPREHAGSLAVLAAIELRREPEHPAWKAIVEHRMAMRQLLEELVKPLDVTDPPAVAARLQLLVEGAEAVAVAGGPVGAPDLRALSEAARC
jgi:AcrR family transcriptional regulator